MRARHPDIEGYVERDGVKVGYEVFGTATIAKAISAQTCQARLMPTTDCPTRFAKYASAANTPMVAAL